MSTQPSCYKLDREATFNHIDNSDNALQISLWNRDVLNINNILIDYNPTYPSNQLLKGKAFSILNYLEEGNLLFNNLVTNSRLRHELKTELNSLVALAELERRRGNLPLAREHLADTWEACERAPYRLIHADGMNVLAQIERDAGNTESAIAAATKAYELAWCDGISEDGEHCYAYWWGLKDAEKHLTELGAPIPKLPPFDPAAHEPLPEIDWDALLKPAEDDSSP